jgi:STE24 endopeptidase
MDYLVPCLVFSWLFYLWDTYLQWRQRRVFHSVSHVPPELNSLLDESTFDKSRVYQLDKSSYGLVHDLFKQVELMVILAVGGIPLLWSLSGWTTASLLGMGPENELSQSMVFVELLLLYSTLTGLPWSIYSIFFLEARHGFNKQTPVFFIKDQTKSLVLELLIVPPIVLGLLYTIQLGGRAFFIYSWLFLAAITFLFVTVYQEFIAPLFDKFSPLPEGALHTSILSLTSSLSFPLKKIQVVEGSKRSAHSNAYLYGFWWNKVIVIFDTLLEAGLLERKEGEGEEEKEENGEVEEEDKEGQKVKGCSQEEVLAVLAHELGHWSLSHTLKLLAVSQVQYISTPLTGCTIPCCSSTSCSLSPCLLSSSSNKMSIPALVSMTAGPPSLELSLCSSSSSCPTTRRCSLLWFR